MACEANGGNRSYTQYYFEQERLGPEPDFAKGF